MGTESKYREDRLLTFYKWAGSIFLASLITLAFLAGTGMIG